MRHRSPAQRRFHRRAIALALGMTAAAPLAGCPGSPGGSKLAPTASPSPGTALTQGATQVQTSGLGDSLATVTLVLHDPSGNRVPGASVGVLGPVLAYGVTSGAADLAFTPLASGSYTLRIAAPGFQTSMVGGISVSASQSIIATVSLPRQGGTLSGKVVDATGKPVAGAYVADGPAFALTDATGAFSLVGLAAGNQTVTVRKEGFALAQAAVNVSGTSTLPTVTLGAGARKVDFVNAGDAYQGTTVAAAFGGLRGALQAAGFTLADGDPTADTWVVVAPQSLPASVTGAVPGFLAGGGKLVVVGEWGGASGYNPDVVNALLLPRGLFVNPDLVRSPDNQGRVDAPVIRSFAAGNPVTTGVTSVGLFQSASLFTAPPAVALATSAANAYQVLDVASVGYVPVAAYAPAGPGLVVALGDGSAWSDATSLPGGADLARLGNKAFMLNVFNW